MTNILRTARKYDGIYISKMPVVDFICSSVKDFTLALGNFTNLLLIVAYCNWHRLLYLCIPRERYNLHVAKILYISRSKLCTHRPATLSSQIKLYTHHFSMLLFKQTTISSLVRIRKLCHLGPGCRSVQILLVVYFPLKLLCLYNKKSLRSFS